MPLNHNNLIRISPNIIWCVIWLIWNSKTLGIKANISYRLWNKNIILWWIYDCWDLKWCYLTLNMNHFRNVHMRVWVIIQSLNKYHSHAMHTRYSAVHCCLLNAYIRNGLIYYANVRWPSWRPELLGNRVFLPQFIQTTKEHHMSAFLSICNRWRMESPHKGTVTRKMFPFDEVTIHDVC